jgi:hypothetical protein
MLTYHIDKSIKSSLDLHPSLIESFLVFGLPVTHIFQFLRKLNQFLFVSSFLNNHGFLEDAHLLLFFLIHRCELPNLMVPCILFLHLLALGLFDLPQLYLEEVLLVLHPQFLPLDELIRVLRICQLPLRLVQLMLHQHLPIAVIRRVVVSG